MKREKLQIGQKFGDRTIIAVNKERKNNEWFSLFECKCGKIELLSNKVVIRTTRKGTSNSCRSCGGLRNRLKLEINTKIGDWIVINPNEISKNGRWHSRVKCKCGLEKLIVNSCINSKKSNSCEICRCKKVGLQLTSDNPWNIELNHIFLTAKKYKRECALTAENVKNLSLANCIVCGRKPYMKSRSKAVKLKNVLRNGIDRIDNSKGYIIENCQTLCWSCNRWKGKDTQETFMTNIKRIVDHQMKLPG